jgi:endonuclease/exonuclease/phosphatase family metal-dependent hydrolase
LRWNSILWTIALGAAAADAAPAPGVVLATYNVENYGLANRRTAAGYFRDYPKPEEEKTALRQVIAALGADVLALQEIGGPAYRRELQEDLRSEGSDYPYAADWAAEDEVRQLALLSKFPLRQIGGHGDLRFPYRGGTARVKRGLLEAVVRSPEGEFTVFVVHLKSHLTERADDPEAADRRVAEAAAVRACVQAEFPDPAAGRYVILGDCNDGRRSPALRRLEAKGAQVIAECLPAVDRRGENWTEYYRGAELYSALDHILVSPALRPAAADGTAWIYDGPGVDRASDHRPVLVRLDLTRLSGRRRP